MSDYYRQQLKEAQILSASQVERLELEIAWRGELIFHRDKEPLARPIVVRGRNGIFPGYIIEDRHIVFTSILCETIEEASDHAPKAMRSILLNE